MATSTLGSGTLVLAGSTSGTTTVTASATAGTTTLTLPATTGTAITSGDTGTVTNTMLAGSIANAKLSNSSVTIGGTAIALGASSSTITNDLTISGLTVGKGGGAVSTNTAVGTSVLQANTSGAYNTIVGYQAGYSNTTGSTNVAIGRTSFYNNTTGSDNTAVGHESSFSNTTGNSNTSLGQQALRSNTTASNNTAVGYQAGYANTTGAYNLFMGYITGQSNTTGTQNTFVGGYGAGNAVTTGGKNTIIGNYSGNNGGLDIRTSDNYIVLSDGDANPRGIFTNSGFLCIGGATATTYNETLRINTANQQGIHINDTTSSSSINYQYFTKGSGPTNVGAIYYNGSVMAYQTTSDYRLKENVAPITNALNKIALLNPVTYRWKDNQQSGEGFIAHELQEHFPDAVSGTKDEVDENGNPKYQGMDASVLIGTMVKAIQELKAEFDAYKATHP